MSTATTPSRTSTPVPAGTWNVDPTHSSVEFEVVNMGLVTVAGFFADFEGSVVSDGTPEGIRAEGVVQAASLNTRSVKRDEHLRAPEFFDVESHPEIRFASKRVEADADGLRIVADFTLHGVTREVELRAVPTVDEPIEDPWGGTRIGLEIEGAIDRRDYGIDWNVKTPGGIPLVSNEVKLRLHLGLVRSEQ
jgi:polyisoprenoid-binding protein YceI